MERRREDFQVRTFMSSSKTFSEDRRRTFGKNPAALKVWNALCVVLWNALGEGPMLVEDLRPSRWKTTSRVKRGLF